MELRCRITGAPFVVTPAELEHIRRMAELNPHLKAEIPPPRIHPLEQLRRQFSFVNYIDLFREQSALSHKPQLSRYSAELGNRICTPDEFWSDAVDNAEFGAEYSFDRPFFEQWAELARRCHLLPLNNFGSEGCEYCNGITNSHDSYLCFNTHESRDCLYCMSASYCSDCVDCVGCARCELCCRGVQLEQCYGCQDCQDCKNSSDCLFCLDLIGCRNCIGCVGLRNAENCIMNRPVGGEACLRFLREHNPGRRTARAALEAECREFIAAAGHRVNRFINTENSSGEYLTNCRSAHQCFFSEGLEDCGFLFQGFDARSCWQGLSIRSELCYKSLAVGGYNDLFGCANADSQNSVYSFVLMNHCAHCFGCAALKNKSYCILNRQYRREEYLDLVPRITAHMRSTEEWGEYFPPALSPQSYAWSSGNLFFEPLEPAQLARRGYRLDPVSEPESEAAAEPAEAVPEDMEEADADRLAGRRFRCAVTGRPFGFQKRELEFYRRRRIPPPQRCWRRRICDLLERRPLIPAVSAP